MIVALLSMLLVFSQPPAATDVNAVAPPAPAADTVPPLAI
jgi:hypothetical protein